MFETISPPPFYPPFVKPAARPLRFPANLIALLNNNLEAIPEQAYFETLVVAPGPPRMAFFTGPDLVKELLVTRPNDFPKGKLQVEVLQPMFGNAMISSEGGDWRWQRSVAAPLFRHEEILQFGSIMSDAAAAIVAQWRAAAPGVTHPIHRQMMRAAFHVISNTMLVGGARQMLDAIEVGHADYYRGANWWVVYKLLGLPHWLPRPGGRRMRAHEQRLREAVSNIVRQRKDSAAADNDLLGRMLRARDPDTGQSITDELLVDNIVSFLVAGYDTTAFALTWTLYLLSQSPEWEARILEEVERVVGDAPVASTHVANLVVVQQVLNESLRLFPTAPVIIRDIVEDMEFNGTIVPAGSIGLIPIYAIHRHRRIWEDPNRFDPSRFAPDSKKKPTRFEYLPFGAGPRICIGASFATIEATIMLATFVRAAHFELAQEQQVRPAGRMFLLPRDGMPMRVTLRKTAPHA